MTKHEKLLIKARNNPNGLSFEEFETLMSGWVMDHQRGSYRISIQTRIGKAKGYQLKQFLTRYDEETTHA